MITKKIALLSTVALLSAGAAGIAQAQTLMVTNDSDLTLRTGPGKDFDKIGDVPVNAAITVDGCLANRNWCSVSYGGIQGWARAGALRVNADGAAYTVAEAPSSVTVKTIEYDKSKVNANAGAGALAGAVTGAAVGGPVGAVVGAVAGTVGGAAVTEPDTKVTTYVTQHPVAPVELQQQQVVVGQTLPGTVTLTPVPESQYAYVYVDGRPVLVDAGSRTVVRVIN